MRILGSDLVGRTTVVVVLAPEHVAAVEECTVAAVAGVAAEHSENKLARNASGYLASDDQTELLSLGLVEGTHS